MALTQLELTVTFDYFHSLPMPGHFETWLSSNSFYFTKVFRDTLVGNQKYPSAINNRMLSPESMHVRCRLLGILNMQISPKSTFPVCSR